MATRLAAEDVRRASVPSDYDIKPTEKFQPPEGLTFSIDSQNPLWAQFKGLSREVGLTQEQASRFIDLLGGYVTGESQSIKHAREAEIAKLGANGPNLVSSINTWMDANGFKQAKHMLVSADIINEFARFIARGSGPSMSQSYREVHDANTVTEEQYNRMSLRERYIYAQQQQARQAANGRR